MDCLPGGQVPGQAWLLAKVQRGCLVDCAPPTAITGRNVTWFTFCAKISPASPYTKGRNPGDRILLQVGWFNGLAPMAESHAPASPLRFRAFISYSHRDEAWAVWLHKALETYRVPSRLVGQITAQGLIPARLTPVFRDRDELPSSPDLNSKVAEALAQSENLIVVCSPHSATSRWVDEEVLAFKRLGRAQRIFCLIVDGEPGASALPGHEAGECFGKALRHDLADDGTIGEQPAEPIAADARPGKDGRANARLKLIAGLLGVGFDRLKQREQQRRLRRMTAVAALAGLVTVVTTVLAINAVVARGTAERRQKQAETLINFMLGDLNDKLQQVSRLDIIESVDDQAMKYFQSLPTTDVTTESLEQRARALQTIGGVRLNQGQTAAAMEAFQSALDVAATVARATPENAQNQLAYANIWAYVGLTHWNLGKLDDAQRAFESAQAIIGKVLARASDDPAALNQLAQIDNNLGHVLEVRGNLAAAQAQYQAMRGIFENLSTRDPADDHARAQLGDAYDNLGKISFEQGHIAEAIAAYVANQRIKAGISAKDPANHDVQESLLISNAILARTLAKCGDIENALYYARSAVDSAQSLLKFDPTQAYWQEDAGYYSMLLGSLLRQSGHDVEAAGANAKAVHLLGELVARDPTHLRWQKEFAQSQLESARLRLHAGDLEVAKRDAAKALDSLGQLRAKHPDDKYLPLLVAQADIVNGRIAQARKDLAAARTHWMQALEPIAGDAKTSDDPDLLSTWATALLLANDVEAARTVVAKLQAMGYRDADFVTLAQSRQLDYPVNEAFSTRIADVMK